MPKIIIRPAGLEVQAKAGDSVMDAAWACGVRWPTSCGGQGECSSCIFVVVSGKENLSSIGKWEARALSQVMGNRAPNGDIRLACQARVLGDVEVEKRGVRP